MKKKNGSHSGNFWAESQILTAVKCTMIYRDHNVIFLETWMVLILYKNTCNIVWAYTIIIKNISVRYCNKIFAKLCSICSFNILQKYLLSLRNNVITWCVTWIFNFLKSSRKFLIQFCWQVSSVSITSMHYLQNVHFLWDKNSQMNHDFKQPNLKLLLFPVFCFHARYFNH